MALLQNVGIFQNHIIHFMIHDRRLSNRLYRDAKHSKPNFALSPIVPIIKRKILTLYDLIIRNIRETAVGKKKQGFSDETGMTLYSN